MRISLLLPLLAACAVPLSSQTPSGKLAVKSWTVPPQRECKVAGRDPVEKLSSVLVCAFDEAKFEVVMVKPSKAREVVAVEFPSKVLVQPKPVVIRAPEFALSGVPLAGVTECWPGSSRDCEIKMQATGDMYEDFDTAVHEFSHYLVVRALGDYGFQDTYHGVLDSPNFRTPWWHREKGE